MRVLITSAARKVWLVKAFQRALRSEGVGEVLAVDSSERAAALRFADKAWVVPCGLGSDFLEVLCDLCRRQAVDLIVPTRDQELPFFSRHKGLFGELGTTVMVAEPGVVDICRDKRRFVDFCKSHGVGVPVTYDSPADVTTASFPVFVKPRMGKGGQGATIARSDAQLRYILSTLTDPLIQEFIMAPEYTIDLFADLSGSVISVVPRERLSVVSGESVVTRTVKDWLLIHASSRLAQALRLIGHNTLQCFVQNDAIKFIEVNPRFGGGANLGFAAGAFTPLYLVKLLSGKQVQPAIGEFIDDYFMLRYSEDVFMPGRELQGIDRLS